MFSPLPSISCALDAAWFWRESVEDGLYQIGGALIRPSGGSRARYLGSQINFELRWALDLHTTIAVNLAGFFTGGFLKATGPADDAAFSNVGARGRTNGVRETVVEPLRRISRKPVAFLFRTS
jgi:hypothetical protein